MPLSPSVQRELRAELDQIEAIKKQLTSKLDERAKAIQAVLEPFEVQTALPLGFPNSTFLSASDNESLMKRLQAEVNHAVAPGAVAVSKFAATGLRAAIINVLQTNGRLRAPAVAQILEQRGFKNDSKTRLPTRVYNDLWRMIERGIVENDEGVFSLKKTA